MRRTLPGLGAMLLCAATFGADIYVPADYATIQAAIDAANPGDVIHVAAGTYLERLTITKTLELRGAQYGVDPTPGGARTNPANEATIDITSLPVQNPNVAIEIPAGVTHVVLDGFTVIGSPTSHYSDEAVIRCWDDHIAVRNNIVDGYFGLLYKGNDYFDAAQNRIVVNKVGITVQPNPATHVTLTGNTINPGGSPAGDAAAIYLTGASTVTVSGNTATGFPNGNGVGGSNLTNMQVTANAFSGCRKAVNLWGNTTFVTVHRNEFMGSTLMGVNIKGQDITISENRISGTTGVGIEIDKHTLDTERVTIGGNDLSGNTSYGLRVTAAVIQLVNASGNWWGDNTAGGVVAEINGTADYTPWLNSGTDTGGDPGFQGDFSALWVDDDSPQVGATGRVQEGIDLVSGSTVYVLAGIYAEAIEIDVPVNLLGAGRDVTTIDATGEAADIAVDINQPGGDVTFDGFTVLAKGEWWPDDTIGMNIVSTTAGATITVTNNRFEGTGDPDNYEFGVYIHGSTASFVFQDNIITEMGSNPLLVERNPGATDVSDNTLDAGSWGSGCFYMTYGATDVTTLQRFNNNTFDLGTGAAFDLDHRVEALSIVGAYIDSYGPGGYSNVEIKNNHIYNGRAYGRGIGLYNDAGTASDGLVSNVVIQGNVIEGLNPANVFSHGLRLAGQVTDIVVANNEIAGMEKAIRGLVGYYGTHYPTDVVVFDNDLSGNGYVAEWAAAGPTLDASGNWFGSNVAATVAGLLDANVDYTPWLDVGTDTSGDPGFQGDFATLWVDDDSPQVGAAGRVQEGVDLVSGSTVNVLAGTYTESVLIVDSVSLLGPNAGINPCAGTRVAEAILNSSAPSGALNVQASDVVIDGFKLANPVYGVVANALCSNLQVRNNHVDGATDTGVNFWRAATGIIERNKIENCLYGISGGDENGTPGFGDDVPTDATVQDNCLSNCRLGITGYHDGSDILRNTVAAFALAPPAAGISGQLLNTTITLNAVSGYTQGAGVALQAYPNRPLSEDVTISYNLIHDNAGGLYVDATQTALTGVVVTQNGILNNSLGGAVNYSAAILDATNNYWGTPDGPADPAGTLETDGSSCPSVADILNAVGVLGNGVTDDNVIYCSWLDSYPRIALEPSASCISDPNQIVIEIWVHDLTDVIQGGQFFLAYDNAVLDFLSADPGDAPFTLQVYESVNEIAGTIDYASGVPLGFPNATLYPDHIMARLTFQLMPAYTELCDVGNLIWFRPHFPPTRLTTTTAPLVVPTIALGEITVDDTAPVVTAPTATELECSTGLPAPATTIAQFLALPGAAASDNCTATADLTVASATGGLVGNECSGTITRTYTITDDCGNSTAVNHVFNVSDNTPPTALCQNITVPLDSSGNVTITAAQVDNGSSDNCTGVSLAVAPSAFNCSHVGNNTVTLTVTDGCGNSSQCMATVTVQDVTPPTVVCNPITVYLDGTGNYTLTAADVNAIAAGSWDACGIASKVVAPNAFTCANIGPNTVTLTVTDVNGNSAPCQATVTVVDNLPPFVTCPADITVNAEAGTCSASVSFVATAADNCDPSPTITYWLGGYGGTQIFSPHTFAAGTYTVTVHAVDDYGNASTCTFTVTVNAYNDFLATVTIQGPVVQATTRGITFTFRDCPGGSPTTICRDMTFPISGGDSTATTTFTDVPCSATAYDCVTAQDALHSLQAKAAPTIVSGQYVASFTGSDKLMQGDLYDDNLIDIVDFGVFIYSWGWTGGPHTPCGFVGPHADMDASGGLDATDYAFITSNFLLLGEDGCCGLLAMGHRPRTALTMSEAIGLGLPLWLDQNADGVFDLVDVQLFFAGGGHGTEPSEGTVQDVEDNEAAGAALNE